jgi:hypothetical protein
MPKKRPRRASATAPSSEVTELSFPAALAPAGSGRKAWTQDSDGEGILSVAVPAYAADKLGGRLALLRDQAFLVVIKLGANVDEG